MAFRTPHKVLLPEGWRSPPGFSYGIVAKGSAVYLAGLVARRPDNSFPETFIEQMREVIQKIDALIADAGAKPEHIVRMVWYVADVADYVGDRAAIRAIIVEHLGEIFPAMTLLQVVAFAAPEVLLEVDVTAVIPD